MLRQRKCFKKVANNYQSTICHQYSIALIIEFLESRENKEFVTFKFLFMDTFVN